MGFGSIQAWKQGVKKNLLVTYIWVWVVLHHVIVHGINISAINVGIFNARAIRRSER